MKESLYLKDHSVNFYFYFIGPEFTPKHIDPRIGAFELTLGEVVFENGIFERYETTKIECKEVDMETDLQAAGLIPYYKDMK